MTVEEALPVVLAVANLADSPESIPKFKEWIVANGYGVYRVLEKDAEWLLGFRDQLRRVWWIAEQFSIGKNSDTHEVQKIFQGWFPTPIDLSDWRVFQNAGKFIPKQHNIRAIAGRIVIHNSTYLARCSVEKCRRFFIKKRKSQILCLSEDCERARNALANQKLRDKKAQQIRQAVARRVVKRKGRA